MLTYSDLNLVAYHWERLEDENQHDERLRQIALYLCRSAYESEAPDGENVEEIGAIFLEYANIFQEIHRRHDRAGSLGPDLYEIRKFMRERLRDKIQEYFGAEALEEINP